MHSSPPPAPPAEVLTFDLSGETFALGAGLVREVTDVVPETAVPGAPGFVSAVANFRGRIIPLADLRPAFGLEERAITRDSRVVVIEIEIDGSSELVGLRADKVHEVTSIDIAQREAPPRIGLRWPADFVEALVRREDGIVVLPDLTRIFAERGRPAAPVTATPATA